MMQPEPTLIVNGQNQPFRPATIAELLQRQGLDPQRPGIAVAVNAEVISRAQWERHALGPGDRVEIVQAQAGG